MTASIRCGLPDSLEKGSDPIGPGTVPKGLSHSHALLRERVGPDLKMHDDRLRTFTAFLQPRCAVAFRYPDAAAFPACARIIDAALETFRVKAQRVGNTQRDEFVIH